MEDCIFCKIASKTVPAQIIWENVDFVAFLDIFPVVPGATVVIPKKHYCSYIKYADSDLTTKLMDAVKEVMNLLDSQLEGNLRTKVVFEGLEIDHLHAKLWPIYKGIREETPQKPKTQEELAKIAERIKSYKS